MIPKDKKRNYRNGTYSRMALYPKTHQMIKEKAKKSEESMMDWLDKLVEQA